jgi:hypothetical protein
LGLDAADLADAMSAACEPVSFMDDNWQERRIDDTADDRATNGESRILKVAKTDA